MFFGHPLKVRIAQISKSFSDDQTKELFTLVMSPTGFAQIMSALALAKINTNAN